MIASSWGGTWVPPPPLPAVLTPGARPSVASRLTQGAVTAVGRAIETWMTKEALAACGNPLAAADIDAESAAALSLGALATNPDPGKARRFLSCRVDFQAWTQA